MDHDLLAPTRIVLLGAGMLAVVAGPILFLFPDDTGTYFAWHIGNALTPSFMGANYLAGAGAFLAARWNRWGPARVILPSIVVFAVTQLVATLLHLDVLDWSHPVAYAWLAVYIVSPIGAVAVLVMELRRSRLPVTTGVPLPSMASPLMILFAAASLLVGGMLFVAPDTMGDVWPWALTPLAGRIIGGWYLSAAALQIMLARAGRLEDALIGLGATVGVAVMQLAGAALNRDAFDGPSASVALYLMGYATLGLSAAGIWLAARRERSTARS